MIPYLTQPTVHLGPVTIAAFGVIVAISVFVGLQLGARRFAALGLDRGVGEGLAWWVIAGGFLGAHLFAVLLYFPEKVAANPLTLLKLWEDISSFGGMLGGAIALWLFLRRRVTEIDAPTRWAYADVVAYVFPVALMIGRLACALAHDHPGTVTSFPLAISLATPAAQSFIEHTYAAAGRSAELASPAALSGLGFHDLGWYEFLYLALVVVPVVFALARRERRSQTHRPGTYLVAFLSLYLPVRFAFDFLRVSDVRYAGLTPAQWTALITLGALPVVWWRIRGLPARPIDTLPRPLTPIADHPQRAHG